MINLRGREKKVLEHIESVKRKIEEFNKYFLNFMKNT